MLSRLVLLLLFNVAMPSVVLAIECAAIFPDGLQNNDAAGNIDFAYNSQLKNSPDNILDSPSDIVYNNGSNLNTCDTGDCTSSYSAAQDTSYTNFPGGDSVKLPNRGSVTLAPGDYSSLSSDSSATLNLSPGDYTFSGSFFLNSSDIVNIIGEGLVRIFVQGSPTIQKVQINTGGSAADLLLYFEQGFSINTQAEISAFIYSNGTVNVGYQVQITGGLSAQNINLNQSIITFSDDELDFGDFCSGSPQEEIPAILTLDYRFDECSYEGIENEVIDQTSNFPATPNNSSLSRNDDIINNALDLTNSGTNDWLSLSKDAVDGLNDFSMSFWLQTDSSKETQSIFHAIGNSGTDDQLMVLLKGSDNIRVFITDTSIDLDPEITVSDGSWNHFVLTRQSAQVCLYVNGALAECNTGDSGAETELSVTSDEGVVIGQGKTTVAGYTFDEDEGLEGKIDEFKLFEGKLTVSEITDIYTNENQDLNYDGSTRAEVDCPSITPIVDYRFDECRYVGSDGEVIDQSENNYNATTNNDPPLIDGRLNNAIDFTADSSADWVQVPKESVDGLDNFSIAVWIKVSSDDINEQSILHALGEDTDDDEIELFFESNKKLKLRVGDQGASLDSAITLADNSWHHIVVTRQSSNACLFVDGEEQECEDDVSDQTTSVTEDNAVYLGQRHDDYGSDFKNGYRGLLDEFKIYDVALTSAEIEEIFDNENTGSNYDGSVRDELSCAQPEILGGRVTLNNTTGSLKFTYVCFDEPFSSVPIVFSMPTTADDSDRLALRIRNVTENGFEIAQVESPEDANPNAPAGNLPQSVDFIAITEGDYDLGGGVNMRVGTHATQTYQAKNINGTDWDTITTTDLNFSEEPAILAFIQTMNNEPNTSNPDGPFPISDPFLATTVRNVSVDEFSLALERGETNSGTISQDEIIGYMAITAGVTGQLTDDISFETLRTSDNIIMNDQCYTFNFNDSYTENPLVVASQNTRDGVDGGWLKRCSLSTTNVGFSVVEDMDADTDNNHTTERAGVLVLGGTFTDYTDSCSVAVDHFEINTQNGTGLTCEADDISIKACSNSECDTLYGDDVDVLLSVSDSNGVVLNKSVTVVGGESDVSYIHTTAEDVFLSLDQSYECSDDEAIPCTVTFDKAGFRFISATSGETDLPVQLSGKPSNIGYNADTFTIEAVQDDGSGACAPLLISGESIEMAASYQTPTTGSQAVDISGTTIEMNAASTAFDDMSFTSVPLDFGDDSQYSADYLFTYPDAGALTLNARYELPDEDGNPSGEYIKGISNEIIVRPFAFEVLVDNNLDTGDSNYQENPGATNANGDDFIAAGDVFRIKTRAVAWKDGDDSDADGMADQSEDLTNNATTENFSDVSLTTITPQLIQPVLTGGQVGDLVVSSSSSFVAGIQIDTATYSEVGIMQLLTTYEDYLTAGNDITNGVNFVGRFIPSYFIIKEVDNGLLTAQCGSVIDLDNPADLPFVYSGQLLSDDLSTGAISYASEPSIIIEARNANDGVTKNYIDGFDKLSLTSFVREIPTSDASQVGADTLTLVSLTAVLNEATKVNNRDGTITYTYASDDHFVYSHEENSEINEFTSDIGLSIASIIDSDEVAAQDYDSDDTNDIIVTIQPTGKTIRFGRAQLDNSYGPETSALPQPLSVNYYQNGQYVIADNDYCSSYDSADMTVSDISLAATLTEPLVSEGKFIDESSPGLSTSIMLDAPGTGNTGQVCVSYDVPSWLQYNWAVDEDNLQCAFESTDVDGLYNDPPFAIATFGIYRGNDRIIYQREISQ